MADIINLLAEALNQQTIKLKKEKFSNLIILLKNKSEQIALKESSLLNYDSIIANYTAQGMSRPSAITQGYQEGKIDINISQKEQELMNSILDGYETVSKIREILTKEKILYQIGAGSKVNEKILQDTLNFEEISPYLYIQHRAEGYSIRIKVSQTMLQQNYQKRQLQAGKSIDQITNLTNSGSTLYSAVYRYFSDARLGKGGVGNWGNFYQAYRLLYHKSSKHNQYHPRRSTIAKAFSQVLSEGGKSGSFATGGDVLREQDKASFGSNPTLTSTRTVINTLKDLANNLQIYINTNSIEPLIKMLIRKNTANKLEKKTYQEAIEALKEALLDIPGIT